MSLTSYEPATPRLHRSELAVPASNPKKQMVKDYYYILIMKEKYI